MMSLDLMLYCISHHLTEHGRSVLVLRKVEEK